MWPYILFFISILGFDILVKYKKIDKKTFLKIVWILLVMLFSLRGYSVGTDTENYILIFKDIISLPLNEAFNGRMEVGFVVLIRVIGFISKNPQILLMVTGIIYATAIVKLIGKYSKNHMASILIFILLMFLMSFMNIMRQALTISIIMIGFKYLVERQNIKFLMVVLLASTFHIVAFIFIIPLIFNAFKLSRKTMIIYLFIGFLLAIFSNKIFEIIVLLLPRFNSYLTDIHGQSNYFAALLDLLFFLILFGVIMIFNGEIETDYQKTLLIIIILQIIFQLFTIRMTIFGRVTTMFSVFLLLSIPEFINFEKAQNKYLMVLWVYIICFAYFGIILVYRSEWNGAIPYLPFWV